MYYFITQEDLLHDTVIENDITKQLMSIEGSVNAFISSSRYLTNLVTTSAHTSHHVHYNMNSTCMHGFILAVG